jgi:hypothetical protein
VFEGCEFISVLIAKIFNLTESIENIRLHQ